MTEPTKITKEKLLGHSELLYACPFCGGSAEFITNKSNQLIIQHIPSAGVCCPARYEQYCETFVQGMGWWNERVSGEKKRFYYKTPDGGSIGYTAVKECEDARMKNLYELVVKPAHEEFCKELQK